MGSPSNSHSVLFFKGIILFVGLHSITLGTVIYFFTDFFYKYFFNGKFHQLVWIVFLSKILAVIFLLTNARYTPSPAMINLAALGDAAMAMVLIAIYTICLKKSVFML